MKKIEYFYLIIAVFGLIGLNADIRINLSKERLFFIELYAVNAYNSVRESVDTYTCLKATKSILPLDNFDEIVKEQNLACDWFKNVAELIPKSGDILPYIKFEDLPKLIVKNEVINDDLELFKNKIDIYNNLKQSVINLRVKSEKNQVEILMRLLSPMFLCIAVALKFTKITGEIRLEKATKKEQETS